MSDRDLEMVKLREQRDDAIQRAVQCQEMLDAIKALCMNNDGTWSEYSVDVGDIRDVLEVRP